jgi:glycosyltransferase involved in cell wall biosynthesis
MLLGLACIATDCPAGGPADLIDQGVNGLLTPVGNVIKMTENLQILLENLHFVEILGINAHKLQGVYDHQKINETWEKFLRGVKRR